MNHTSTNKTSTIFTILSIHDFRMLWIGSATSLLGDQFSMIATSWLVLKLTSDPMALGFSVALQGVPRAIFMLVGGAITDRFSPRMIMLVSDVIRLVLTAIMALLVFSGMIELWMLYVFSLAFGVVAGFSIPASSSILPMLIPEEYLQPGNAIVMGTGQLTNFIGPTLAGIMIAQFTNSSLGITLAYTVDTITFVISALALWLMRNHKRPAATDDLAENSVMKSILVGFRYLWHTPTLRVLFIVMSIANFLVAGPLLVGIPVMADQRLVEGVTAFGLLISAYAGGNLLGYILAAVLPKVSSRLMTFLIIALLLSFGLGIGILGWITITPLAFTVMLLLGIGNGYISIFIFTQVQARTPKDMLGRMMSMIMLSNLGLAPVSQALSGIIIAWSLTGLFAIAGGLLLILACWTAFQPEVKTFGAELTS